MRFRRPRFTIRWLMVAVAAIAILLTAGMLLSHWPEYRDRWPLIIVTEGRRDATI